MGGHLRANLWLLVLTLVCCSVLYPLVLWGIGRTPLLRLDRFTRRTPRVELFAKAEFLNPGGSVKDRAAAVPKNA